MKDFSRTGIIVMDVGEEWSWPEKAKWKEQEVITSNKFIDYLDSRLVDLQKQGAKIIEASYSGTKHTNLTVNFDYTTTTKKMLYRYMRKNNIVELIYTGFHYPICVTHARPVSAYKVVGNPDIETVSIAIQLTRSMPGHFNMPLEETQKHGVRQVML